MWPVNITRNVTGVTLQRTRAVESQGLNILWADLNIIGLNRNEIDPFTSSDSMTLCPGLRGAHVQL